MDYCCQYDCKQKLNDKYICELCNKNYCVNCMYLICSICHKKFACFSCGSQEIRISHITGYCKLRTYVTGFICCSKHINTKYEERKCEVNNCSICKN